MTASNRHINQHFIIWATLAYRPLKYHFTLTEESWQILLWKLSLFIITGLIIRGNHSRFDNWCQIDASKILYFASCPSIEELKRLHWLENDSNETAVLRLTELRYPFCVELLRCLTMFMLQWKHKIKTHPTLIDFAFYTKRKIFDSFHIHNGF